MSLAFSALRFAAVMALKGRTLAGNNVLDSEIGPIDDTPQPVIVVYTDDLTLDDQAPLHSNRGALSLTVATLVTSRTTMMVGPDEVVWPVPPTDAGLELAMDRMGRDIQAALSDPANEWAEHFRRLCLDWRMVSSERGSNAREGLRLAGREIKFQVTPIADPVPGDDLSPVWEGVIAAAEAEIGDDARGWALLMRQALQAPTRDAIDMARALYGFSSDVADALLLSEHGGDDVVYADAEPAQ